MKNLSHSELWINTDYFVQAIRCICSLTYLEEHNEICQLIDAKDFIDGKLHRFYINLCALVDIHCKYTISNSKRAAYKKMLITMCPSFDWIFYERDKDAAHKDLDYVCQINTPLCDLLKKMKHAVNTTKFTCTNIVSDKIEYEYYSYDSLLFRYINGITPELEKKYNDSIYIKNQIIVKENEAFINISDPRQTRNLYPDEKYCVIGDNGLMGQPYDMLEHRQNMCIRLNALYGCDAWVILNKKNINEMLKTMFETLSIIRKTL